ncbi:hypothetical protein TD95_003563 [Thielaviopsis punctulata]|uniref:GAR domain-containing protein n=1 Tax=Thielaviopsis punctulata TaxID=72032 RepID=A0A0F4ZCE4_9PEZI|nr:hypothetical protein TD95_003563 [Thielaviopsis punctulata]
MERQMIIPSPGRKLLPARRPYSTTSPTRRSMAMSMGGNMSDDLLFHLTPTSAVNSLNDPTGSLKTCLARATQYELEFAMRAAVAASKIQEWLDELLEWPWPAFPGPEGFTMATASIRPLEECGTIEAAAEITGCFVGYLPARDVLVYEKRIEKILQELDGLAIDEIKSHVLMDYIMPTSRPGSPLPSHANKTNTHRLTDYATVLTAIVLQALPYLSRLSHYLNIWSLRLSVLRRIPPFFVSLVDAETALRSGWKSLGMSSRFLPPETPRTPLNPLSTFSQTDFAVMKAMIEMKISTPGQILDFMLDQLEGHDDTLPDKWFDRVENIENDYGEWVAACEMKMRQADYDKIAEEHAEKRVTLHYSPGSTSTVPTFSITDAIIRSTRSVSMMSTVSEADSLAGLSTELESPLPITSESSYITESSSMDITRDLGSSDEESLLMSNSVLIRRSSGLSSCDTEIPHCLSESPMELTAGSIMQSSSPMMTDGLKPNLMDSREPRALDGSATIRSSRSTRVRSSNSREELNSDDGSFIRVAKSVSRASSRSDPSDDQFQQQISEILEHIPAKITLSTGPKKVDLNPPDLNLPKLRKKTSREPATRSMSSVSARSQTPSFTLAPAERNPRPRRAGQQEIKVYYLSRSTGEAPIKLFIRLVGEGGERVMVRVGGGWADLGEYLKEYAMHHCRRNGTQVDRRALRSGSDASSPPKQSPNTLDASPITPVYVRTARKSSSAADRPPIPPIPLVFASPRTGNTRSRSSSSSGDNSPREPVLGLSGPKSKPIEMTEEGKAWVRSVTESVRMASGETRLAGGSDELPPPPSSGRVPGSVGSLAPSSPAGIDGRFGQISRVGGTKRLFRRG